MTRTILTWLLSAVVLLGQAKKEEPVGLVLLPGGAKLIRAGVETPLAAKPGDKLKLTFKRGEETKEVEVELKISKTETLMRIRDAGTGFRPDLLPDPTDEEHLDVPHGRGVMLIRQMMDRVDYNDCGNQVTMFKQRTE